MLLKTKGKVENLMREHLEKVSEAVSHFKLAIDAYLNNDMATCEKESKVIHEEETKADEIKKKVEYILYEGAYLPIFREDFLNLLELVDDIVDDIERVVDLLVIENPQIPAQWREKIKSITEKSCRAFDLFRECFLLLYEDTEKSFTRTHEVEIAEKQVDRLQYELMREVFHSDLELAQKMHLKDLIIKIGYISDSSENASDKVRAMAVKRKI